MMNQNVPIHDFSICEENEILFEIFVYSPLTVTTPILAANYEPHRHSFYEVMYLTGGKGDHIIDFETYEHRPPILYFLSPGQIHFFDLYEKIEGYVFLFKEDFLVSSTHGGEPNEFSFFHNMLDTPAFSLDHDQQARLEPLIEAMVLETNKKEVAQRSVLQAYFHIFLITIQRICGEKLEMGGEVSLVRQFKKIVSRDIGSKIDIRGCAAELGVSVTHLRKIIREKTGKSPGLIIRQEVAMEAKRLLTHTDLSAAEVAYSLGFDDPSYFGRYFKREIGVSPGDFRHQIGEKYQLKIV